MQHPFHESDDERKSRNLLLKFLSTTDALLERFLQKLVLDVPEAASHAGEQLRGIWASAQENLTGVRKSVDVGLSRTRREALHQVGMFGEALASKWELLAADIRAGAVKRVLKRVNSMLGSLAKAFPALHAVKEFKDHIEATIEGMNDIPDLITLKDLLNEQ
jgi:hypothetical protein